MKNSFSSNGRSGFFYVRSNQNTAYETNPYRVKTIEETAGYLSIPVEVKYALFTLFGIVSFLSVSSKKIIKINF
ncbi:MAG TPA: hypothetical protein PLY32_03455 [Salinivirgaceae bacterium]|nr:hypothetical protein [Salinivirgaceae bacterium]HQA76155.1 hypothetical protein [Salinivirgaceae bacterium]